MKKPNETTGIGKACLSGGLTGLTILVWEIMEELLENLIALGISFIFSTIMLIIATQGIKLTIKKMIKAVFPIVKSYTYRQGVDKMNALKKYWTKVWGNKITGTSVGLGFAGIAYFTLQPVVTTLVLVLAVLLTFVLFFNLAIFFGGETLTQIQERLAQAKLDKRQRFLLKKAQDRIKAMKQAESQSEADKTKAEAEEKAKQEEEAEIQKIMDKLLSEEQK